jgi:hypothetical protein
MSRVSRCIRLSNLRTPNFFTLGGIQIAEQTSFPTDQTLFLEEANNVSYTLKRTRP